MPITPPWPPLIETMSCRLRSNVGLFRSPLTGLTQRTARTGSWWEFDVRFSSVEDSRFYAWRATLAKLQDEAETMYWSAYPRGAPLLYPDPAALGGPHVNGASQTGRTIITDGWTAGVTLKAGDYIGWSNGTARVMHIITADVTANGSGQATIAIAPAIVRSPADDADIFPDGNNASMGLRCVCEVMIDPETPFTWDVQGYSQSMAFRLIEVPR